MNCQYCKGVISKPQYNQIYCSNECRKEKYDDDRIQIKKLNPCEICGFWLFVEKHHIIKQVDWGSNSKQNLVNLCLNHHRMADSHRYEKKFLKLLKSKTGKIGEKLSNEEIQRVKEHIFSILKKYNSSEINYGENSFSFRLEHRNLIQWGEFYKIANKDFKNPVKMGVLEGI